MITGAVNHSREATVDLTIRGPAGREARLEFVIDTGFTGSIALHPAVAAALDLPQRGGELGKLADGSVIWSRLSEALLLWNGIMRPVSVNIADNVALLGMQLLQEHELSIRVVPGGEVRISELRDVS